MTVRREWDSGRPPVRIAVLRDGHFAVALWATRLLVLRDGDHRVVLERVPYYGPDLLRGIVDLRKGDVLHVVDGGGDFVRVHGAVVGSRFSLAPHGVAFRDPGVGLEAIEEERKVSDKRILTVILEDHGVVDGVGVEVVSQATGRVTQGPWTGHSFEAALSALGEVLDSQRGA